MNNRTHQILALAGLAQAALLVQQLSTNGVVSQDRLEIILNSLFVMNPKQTVDVYGSINNLKPGLHVLQDAFQGKNSLIKSPDIMRYILGLLHVEGKLHENKTMLNTIGQRLEFIQVRQTDANFACQENITKEIAEIYQSSISTLKFRIQVRGNMNYLKNSVTIDKIRAILLAGIRSAVLWRQLDGKRWHLLFYRKKYLRIVDHLLTESANIYH